MGELRQSVWRLYGIVVRVVGLEMLYTQLNAAHTESSRVHGALLECEALNMNTYDCIIWILLTSNVCACMHARVRASESEHNCTQRTDGRPVDVNAPARRVRSIVRLVDDAAAAAAALDRLRFNMFDCVLCVRLCELTVEYVCARVII